MTPFNSCLTMVVGFLMENDEAFQLYLDKEGIGSADAYLIIDALMNNVKAEIEEEMDT